jgi:hypothetical protein
MRNEHETEIIIMHKFASVKGTENMTHTYAVGNAFQLGYDSHKTGLQNPFWIGSRPCKEFSKGQTAAMYDNVKYVFCLVDFSIFLTKNKEYILVKENESSFVVIDDTAEETGFQKDYFLVNDVLN